MDGVTSTLPSDEEEGEAAPKTEAQTDAELLAEARERFKHADEAWSTNRKAAIEDMKFRAGDQWPAEVVTLRNKPGAERPCLVVDKLNQYIRQVVNDGRQNRPAVKVRPVDDKGDVEVAEAFQGIIRHICNRSNADQAFDTALEHAVVGGFGYFRIVTEYAHENTFNQEIGIKRVRNPLAILLDPNAQEADGSDAMFGFVIDEIPKKKFKSLYPDAKFTDFESNSAKYSDGWESGDNVRICEYFYKIEEPSTLHLLADGTTVSDEEYQRSVKELGPDLMPAIEETRSIPVFKVKWCRLSGAEILEKNDWLGKYIPIIPVYGNEYDLEGKVIYSGLIRTAKDAQRLYNYSRSAYAERVALTPKAPYIAAAGQIEGFEDEWESANSANLSVLPYNPLDINGTAVPPPQRQQASDIPEGFARDMQLSEHDIQGALGMYASSLGNRGNATSGRQELAQIREADTGTFHYQDNQARAVNYMGRQIVDLAPKVYDSRRAARMLGEDGEATMAEIDPEQTQAVQKVSGKSIYNLNVGTYDVTVTTGPSYTTKRQEASEGMMQLVKSAPETMQFAGDIIARNMDWPGADELAERYKLMLPPQIQQALQSKEGDQSPEVAAVKQQAQQAIQAKDQQIQAAEQGIQQRDAEMKRLSDELAALKAGKEIDRAKVEVEKYKAETERMALDPAITPEAIKAVVGQTVTEIMNQPAPAEPATPATNQPAPAGFLTPNAPQNLQ